MLPPWLWTRRRGVTVGRRRAWEQASSSATSRAGVLLVQPTYPESWEIPGGLVEADESPRTTCSGEVEEELGLRRTVGRLLCMEWQAPEPDRSESLMFV